MRPTDICFRSECSALNCRKSWIKEPLPKEFVIEAWNASVGYSFESVRTHEAYSHISKRRRAISIGRAEVTKDV